MVNTLQNSQMVELTDGSRSTVTGVVCVSLNYIKGDSRKVILKDNLLYLLVIVIFKYTLFQMKNIFFYP